MKIQFTGLEADVLRHRLGFLAELDAEDLEELFPEHDNAASLAEMAEAASSQLNDGHLAVTVSHPDTIMVLEEAVEGSTFLEMAKEALQAGSISQQKMTAYRRALASASEKIKASARLHAD